MKGLPEIQPIIKYTHNLYHRLQANLAGILRVLFSVDAALTFKKQSVKNLFS